MNKEQILITIAMPLTTIALLLLLKNFIREDVAAGFTIIALISYYSVVVFFGLKKMPQTDLGMILSAASIFIMLVLSTL